MLATQAAGPQPGTTLACFNIDMFAKLAGVFDVHFDFSWVIFPVILRASNQNIVDKKDQPEFAFKLSYLDSNFTLTLSYSSFKQGPAQTNMLSVIFLP